MIGMKSRAARGGRYHHDPETRGIGVNIPGAFADFVRVPAFNIVPLPDDVDDELGAILDPLGNAVHTALAFDLVGEDVLITGAGPIGIMAGTVARHVGARHVVITDINPRRLKLAEEVADVVRSTSRRPTCKQTMSKLKMTEASTSRSRSAARRRLRPAVRRDHHRRPGRPARPPGQTNAGRLEQGHLQAPHHQGHLWAGDVRDRHKMIAMLESGLDVRKVITHRLPASHSSKASRLCAEARAARSCWIGRDERPGKDNGPLMRARIRSKLADRPTAAGRAP